VNTEQKSLDDLFGPDGLGSDSGLLNRLPWLSRESASTPDLVEALDLLPEIARCLRSRISARNIIASANRKCPATMAEVVADTYAKNEAQKVDNAHVHPGFAPILNMMRGDK